MAGGCYQPESNQGAVETMLRPDKFRYRVPHFFAGDVMVTMLAWAPSIQVLIHSKLRMWPIVRSSGVTYNSNNSTVIEGYHRYR